jgi:hypothetical protein
MKTPPAMECPLKIARLGMLNVISLAYSFYESIILSGLFFGFASQNLRSNPEQKCFLDPIVIRTASSSDASTSSII